MQTDPHIQIPQVAPAVNAPTSMVQTFYGPAVDDIEIDGLDLEAAAQTLGIGVDDVWRRIRNGQILARSYRGKVYVYTQSHASTAIDPVVQSGSNDNLPPPPLNDVNPSQIIVTQMNESVASDGVGTGLTLANREIALLIDHLSLIKDENRDIITFTRESMSRLTEMTDTMLQMKDDVISAREQQVQMLNERMQQQAHELRIALREKENLETLARALTRDEKSF